MTAASIVITNHDHGRFVAQAIDSDSDDVLYPDAVSRISSRFGPRIAKVQGRLDLIDDRSHGLGRQTAPLAMPSGDLLPVVLRHGWYPAPPTSGNAFARATLEALLPVPASYARLSAADGRLSVSDHYLSVLAPFRGGVVSLPEPLGAYRIHTARRTPQRSALLANVRRRIERTAALSGIVRRWAGQRGLSASADLSLGTLHGQPDVVEGFYPDYRTGDHRERGAFWITGPGIAARALASPVSITDFAPTIGELLGVPLPGLDGRPIPGVTGLSFRNSRSRESA